MSEKLNKKRRLWRKPKLALVLSTIARCHFVEGDPPRNKELTERLSLSKGAVSNKCRELLEGKYISRTDNNRFRVDEATISSRYRSYIRRYLKREAEIEPYEKKIKLLNEIRTYTRDHMEELLSYRTPKETIQQLLRQGILHISDRSMEETILDAFRWTDRSIRSVAKRRSNTFLEDDQVIDEANDQTAVLLLAACMDHYHPDIPSILEEELDDPAFTSVDPVHSDPVLKAMEEIGLLDRIRSYDPAEHEAHVTMSLRGRADSANNN